MTSVDAAVINNSYAQSADVDYDTTLYKEAVDETQINGLTLLQPKRLEKSDKADAIKTLVSVYQTNEVGKSSKKLQMVLIFLHGMAQHHLHHLLMTINIAY